MRHASLEDSKTLLLKVTRKGANPGVKGAVDAVYSFLAALPRDDVDIDDPFLAVAHSDCKIARHTVASSRVVAKLVAEVWGQFARVLCCLAWFSVR